jgi:hypothetical protein
LVFATSPTLTGAIIDGTTIPARTNPLAQAVSVQMTESATVGGIQQLSADDLNMGTNDFTLQWEGALPDYTPASSLTIISKRLIGGAGYRLILLSTGIVRVALNDSSATAASFDSTLALSASDGSFIQITFTVLRTDLLDTVTFYKNGVQLGSSVTAVDIVAESISNTDSFRIASAISTRLESNLGASLLFNRALTAAEVLDLSINGPALADRGASQTPVYESDFSAGVDGWTGASMDVLGNVDGIDGVDNVLSATCSSTGSSRRITKTVSITDGARYSISFSVNFPVGNDRADSFLMWNQSGAPLTTTSLAQTDVAKGSWQTFYFEFVASGSATAIRIYTGGSASTAATTTLGDIMYVSSFELKQIGITSELIASNAQSDTGQILDSSGNKNHALLPASGATVVGRPVSQTREVRWTNTWDGTNELQYIGGVNQAIIPANAYIESIVGTVSGATPHDIIVGNGSDTNRYVKITTGLAAGTTNFALAARTTDGTNLKLTVDPDTNATMSIAWVISYRTLEA